MSGRADILAAVEACLKSISKANGFAVDVAQVKRGDYLQHELKPRPALYYLSPKRASEDLTEGQTEAELTVIVGGWVDAKNGNHTTFDALIADVEIALMTETYNSVRNDTFIKELYTAEAGGGSDVAAFYLVIKISYEYPMNEP